MASAPSTPSHLMTITEAIGHTPSDAASTTGDNNSAIIRINTPPQNRGGAIPANSDDELARAVADIPGSSALVMQQVTRTTVQPHPAKRRAVLPSGDYDDPTEQARQLDALREMLQTSYAERCHAVQQKEWLLSNEFQQRCAGGRQHYQGDQSEGRRGDAGASCKVSFATASFQRTQRLRAAHHADRNKQIAKSVPNRSTKRQRNS